MCDKECSASFAEFVGIAQPGAVPYAYQADLSVNGLPELLRVPTGAGKTMAAVLPWLWRALRAEYAAETPRRLVYVLPLRSLVEQTAGAVAKWLHNLGLRACARPEHLSRDDRVVLQSLMGGTERDDDAWQLDPDRHAVIIGTQDMILSRALMRGYAEKRPHWPISYALLHADTQWVFDETQLLGPALPTSAQLQGLRDTLGTAAPTRTMWMSATLAEDGLATVDHARPLRTVELSAADRAGPLARRLAATRTVTRLDLPDDAKAYPAALARELLARHEPGTRTIAVLNTVERATAVFDALRKQDPAADAVLIHSRFRARDRRALMDQVTEGPSERGRIVISTQVLEAGVDITAKTLFTELAPWSSTVQRAGRCNRGGEYGTAALLWSAPPKGRASASPYEQADLDASAKVLVRLEGRPVTSTDLQWERAAETAPLHPVLRRRDLLQLFDTAPDLTGSDIDISPWIRDGDDTGAFVAWRDWSGSGGRPPEDEPTPTREELCPAPLADVRKLVRDGRRLWLWDRLGDQWRPAVPADLVPGVVLTADAAGGGYDPRLGWAPTAKTQVKPITPKRRPAHAQEEGGRDDTLDRDDQTFDAPWISLDRHLDDVDREVRLLTGDRLTGLTPAQLAAAALAGRYHDLGKCHDVFQETLRGSGKNPPAGLLAKSPGYGPRHSRRYFRHELVSALMLLDPHGGLLDGAESRGELDPAERDLVVYLAAAHHGKVRITVRSAGEESELDPPRVLGVQDGDRTPEVEIGPKERVRPLTLDLSALRVGSATGRSWTAMALRLRDRPDLGPFRLAYLETLVRIADMRVSRSYREETR